MDTPNLNERLERLEQLTLLAAKEALTIDDAALITGLKKSHLYRLTSDNNIPFYKPRGGRIYFHKRELQDWMLQNRQPTHAEAQRLAATYLSTHLK